MVLLILLLIVYRSAITATVPLLSVVVSLAVAKPIVSVLVDRDFIGISLFSLGLSVAVVVGAGTGFAMFLIGRYHERRRQHIAPAAALADAYRGVAPAIAGATFIVVTSLGAVGWLSLARIGMFATTGILCSIGVLAVGLAALTLTPALVALASRANLLKPPQHKRIQRQFRRLGTHVARWPAPILVASGVFVLIMMIALPRVPIGWDEAAATPSAAESNRGYRAADRHFAPNQLLPTQVMIETDHDIRNPAGLTAIERITAAIMAIGGVRMVQSASHPNGMVSKQAALTASAGNLGDQLDEFSDQLTSRQATFTNLEAAVRDVVSALDLVQAGIRQDGYGLGQVSRAVRLMQQAITKLQGSAGDVFDIFDPLRRFVAAIPECRANPVCSVAQEVVQWANTVTESCAKLADAAGQLARGIADVASATSGVSGYRMPWTALEVSWRRYENRPQAFKSYLTMSAQHHCELPDYLRELAAVSQSAPGVDLYAARRILTDPNMRAVLDYFVSPNGHATRLLVYGDGSEWGDDGAQRARAIVTAVAEETDEGTLRPTAVELTGVGPATRDLQDLVGSDLTLLAVITLAVIFAIAALLLRSPLAGLVVVGTIATSYICALGASVVIWKHILGDNLHWSVLPIAFVLLISVGSAYNLLFALRIREESSAGPRTSVIRAFAATGMVVTAAGIVFGTTMFALAASTSLSVAQIGVTVGMGLLLDALVIRGFVLPALMVLLGRWLWWPRRSVSNRQVPEPSPA